ncbi:MAG: thiamine diphosphokinase [candidate division Zixibacteria bacterium]|nr:thiamine diphosphokinase [candidate division Zixibacteria bacterium]
MRKAVLFLNGRYQTRDIPYYRKLAKGCFKIAVDRGYRFFERSGLVADLLIGDFDSLKRFPRRLSSKTRVARFPVDKDKTDTELALDYCLEHGISKTDLVQPSLGDPDHFLANLYLLTRASRQSRTPQLRLIGPDYEALLLSDSRVSFRKAKGSVISVIPVSASIKLTCRGTAFDVTSARISLGQTRSTRNRVTAATSWFDITGKAFVIRQFSRARII